MGGPWANSRIKSGEPSDPYLMTGYDQKSVSISHSSPESVNISLEIDIDGNGSWVVYRTFTVKSGETIRHEFPEAFGAYWARGRADHDTTATMIFEYR